MRPVVRAWVRADLRRRLCRSLRLCPEVAAGFAAVVAVAVDLDRWREAG